ncbi:MAG: hypothetical protein PVI06_09570 [Desulfobacterales bacterium]|jgi:hypothetical protein
MYQVRTDFKKNRLYFTLVDPSRKELSKALKEVEKLCLTLQPNFTCLTDMRHCIPITEEARDLFAKKQNRMWGLGVGKTVRVVLDSDAGMSIMQSLRSITAPYQTDYATSIPEAEIILDNYKKEIDCLKSTTDSEMFKIIDMDGWVYEKRFLTYDEAIKNLKQVRQSGRQTAIVVDACVAVGTNINKTG